MRRREKKGESAVRGEDGVIGEERRDSKHTFSSLQMKMDEEGHPPSAATPPRLLMDSRGQRVQKQNPGFLCVLCMCAPIPQSRCLGASEEGEMREVVLKIQVLSQHIYTL